MFFREEILALSSSQTVVVQKSFINHCLPYWFSYRLNQILDVRPIHLLHETTRILFFFFLNFILFIFYTAGSY